MSVTKAFSTVVDVRAADYIRGLLGRDAVRVESWSLAGQANDAHVMPIMVDTPPGRDEKSLAWPSGRGGKHPHFCVSCSNGVTAGPGCGKCRSTGFDQTPWPNCEECLPVQGKGSFFVGEQGPELVPVKTDNKE